MKATRRKEKKPRIGGAKQPLFPRRARTWIVTFFAVFVVSFIVLPLIMNRSAGANAVYVSANARYAESAPTPEPTIYEAAASLPESTEAPTPEPTASALISNYATLQENDDYPSVQNLQVRLMELGYLDSDEPTTFYGPATKAAVALFQRTLSYEMNGVATSELQENLYGESAAPYEVKLGDSGTDVESMQSRLNELGYYDGKINGYFGVATESALQAFETKNKVDTDGVFSISDRELMYSPSAKPKIDPTPTPTPKPTPTKTPKPTKTSSGTTGGSTSGGSTATSTPATQTSAPTTGDSSGDSSSSGDTTGGSYSASYSADGLISVATAMKGVQYSWSEESPSRGFDCSGLVYFCLRTCGVSTSRYSASGFSQVSRWGYVGSISELQRGDLVFFKNDTSSNVSHTGIYLGGGSFIHASSSAGKVIVSSIGTSYWTRNFICGRRVF